MPTISYNTLFSEACSEGKIVDYFFKNEKCKKQMKQTEIKYLYMRLQN